MTTNPFSATGFDLISMTQAINRVPDGARMIGRTDRAGLYANSHGIATTTIEVEEMNGVLNLVTSKPRGGVADKNTTGKRKVRNFRVPHFPIEDVIRPEEVQDVRMFGSDNQAETAANVMARKLAEMRRKLDLTKEWLRFASLKGILLDSDGSTLYNFFTEFGLSQQTQSFELDQSTTDVNEQCRIATRYIDTHLLGDVLTGYMAYCSPTFYDAFIKHSSVKDAFKYFQNTNQTLDANLRGRFNFGGIVWEEVASSTTDSAGVARKFVTDDKAILFPLGTNECFEEVYAPADFMETANTIGIPYYAKQEPLPFNRGVNVHAQMNVLPICKRPDVLVELTLT